MLLGQWGCGGKRVRYCGRGMWRVAVLWLAAVEVFAMWPVGARAQDLNLLTGFMSLMSSVRPAKAVVSTVRANAPDLFMTLSQRLETWGYPLETHTVRTEDGYLLTVHRIPRGRGTESNSVNSSDNSIRPPVLLQHGIISCSEYWTGPGPNRSLALLLADRGYDVWLNNIRGNHYSRKHEKMGRRDKKFWRFSWHEMGMYDIPAVIDYVLNVTHQEKLFFVSHSMGNTVFYVAMSMRPEYNAKIRLQVSLAPAVFLNESASVPAQLAIANAEYLKNIVDALPTYELLPKTDAAIALNYLMCSDKAYLNKMCAVLLSWIVGALDLNNTADLSMLFARSSSSTSALVPWHFAQISKTGDFTQMDHGVATNLRTYGTPYPPKYPLQKVTVPVAMYASDADFIVSRKGTDRLSKELPNVVLYKVIQEKFFNHLNFVFHPQVKELLMDHVLETMAQF